MQRNLQTHQINPMAFSERCYLGLSGVGLAAKWLRGLDLNQRPLGYEPNELPGCSTPQIDYMTRGSQGQSTSALVRSPHRQFEGCYQRMVRIHNVRIYIDVGDRNAGSGSTGTFF